MTDEIDEVIIRGKLQKITEELDGLPGNIQELVIGNMVAAFALATMANGHEPYGIARKIYRNTKDIIGRNLAAEGMLTKLPKGSRAN